MAWSGNASGDGHHTGQIEDANRSPSAIEEIELDDPGKQSIKTDDSKESHLLCAGLPPGRRRLERPDPRDSHVREAISPREGLRVSRAAHTLAGTTYGSGRALRNTILASSIPMRRVDETAVAISQSVIESGTV